MSYYVSLFCCFVSIGFMMLRNVEKRHSGYWRKPMYGWGVRKSVWIWRNGGAPTEVLSHLSVDVWGETVCWMEQVHDSRLCEKQSSALLAQLYNLKSVELEKGLGKQDALLQQILEFYCF